MHFPRTATEAEDTTATIARPFPPSIRVSNAVAHFAASLPFRVRCSDDLHADGLGWAERNVAVRRREIAPDPPGWRTALRFDVDCPCDRRQHAKAGHCPRAAAYWREAGVAEPSFIVVNPRNGHAHVTYLLRGWVRTDGSSDSDLAAVRYMVAVEKAYARALRADAGYAGLVTHNPFHPAYDVHSGRDEPYSLRELAACVELPRMVPQRSTEIRTYGRNVETFDRLRHWAYAQISEYRCGPRDTWNEVVDARALAIAAEVRAAHAAPAHPYTDSEALDTAKSVAGWTWMRYVGGSLTRVRAGVAVRRERDRQRATAARRARGAVPRDVWLAEIQLRRVAAAALRRLGVPVDEIARRLSAGIRSVQRWLSEFGPLVPSAPGPSALSDFERPPTPKPDGKSPRVLIATSNEVVEVALETPGGAPVGGADGEDGVRAHSAQPASDVPTPGGGVRGGTKVAPRLGFIQRRIAAIVARCRAERPP